MNVNKINVNDQHQATFPSIESSNSDLTFEDNNGYALALFKNGHFKTKNFDSKVTVQTIENDVDLGFIDSSNNCLMYVSNGHIKTKNFNSATLENTIDSKIDEAISQLDPSIQINKFRGKRLAIVGDSISTFSGTMPSGYAIYYPAGDVQTVDKLWWHIICTNLGMSYTNTAWSGSRVTGAPTGNSAAAGCSNQRVIDAGRDGTPDIIIFYISCNDWSGGVEIGTWKTSDSINKDVTTNVTTLREAYALMLYKFLIAYPNARMFVCTNLDDTARDNASGWPSNNSKGVSTYEWYCNIREVAEALGARVIDLHACGLNYMNIRSYCVDSGLHPNTAGQKIMADFIQANLIANY